MHSIKGNRNRQLEHDSPIPAIPDHQKPGGANRGLELPNSGASLQIILRPLTE